MVFIFGDDTATWFVLGCLSAAIWIYLLFFRGAFWHANQRLPTGLAQPDFWPDIAVVIPARNEQGMIGRTLKSLQNQEYPGELFIIVVNDNSEDCTESEILDNVDAQTQLLSGVLLNEGWTGKLWALQQGVEMISRLGLSPKFFLFCDADVEHPADSIRKLVLHAEHGKFELVSLMVRLSCRTAWEILLIPAYIFFFQKLYPFPWINDPARDTAGAAGGCILLRAATLFKAGGLEKIRDQVIDDCALARLIKPHGPVWIGLTQEVICHRTYTTLKEIWHMVIRTAYDQLNYSRLRLIFSVIIMTLMYIVPPTVFICGIVTAHNLTMLTGLISWIVMTLCFIPTLRLYKRWPIEALLLPMAALLYTLMTIDSARRYWLRNNPKWKGRANIERASGRS